MQTSHPGSHSPSPLPTLRLHTPLHKLTASLDTNPTNHIHILQRLKSHPSETQIRNVGGWLPIHYATGRDIPLDVIRVFIIASESVDSSSSILLTPGGGGWLPLHYASRHCSLEVIKYLVKVRPETLRIKNDYGKYPIDVARSEKRDDEILRFLGKRPHEVFAEMETEDVRVCVKMCVDRCCKGGKEKPSSISSVNNFFKIVSWLKQGREMDILANSIVEYLGVTEEEAGGMLESRLKSV
ncbi:hypothetical protein TL16_g05567 [Triparma laevis f. inornata]|uniref:Uncharacterized protein n=2 Tax=Triparma laevis TaxID=1534972 RepID=A0A9W6ZSN4_9STRA|nr:hypothetical protein TrLO_g5954 [Triparma laevis f. longispina]GMH71112.1 hypothetical protein TL16_g05567 [Triparma laevis f. inornata]